MLKDRQIGEIISAALLLLLAFACVFLLARSDGRSAPYVPAVNADMNCTTSGQIIYYDGTNLVCGNNQAMPLSGTTGSIGGGLLVVGGCTTGTATVAGATTTMLATASPQGGINPGAGAIIMARVSAANTVTVTLCALVAITPPSTTYAVRVFP